MAWEELMTKLNPSRTFMHVHIPAHVCFKYITVILPHDQSALHVYTYIVLYYNIKYIHGISTTR